MKIRKLPFGYEMRMGKICVKEQESTLVKQIFQSYSEGDSYNQIVGILSNQPSHTCKLTNPGTKTW